MGAQAFDRLFTPRTASAVALAAAVAILATVFAMEHLGGLAPCPLCITQRWPYGAAILFAAGGLWPGLAPAARRALLALAGAAFLTTAGIGLYHAGVELKIFEGPQACGGAISATTLEALREQLRAAPVVRCDEVPWSLFGISLAGWNAIVAAALAAFSLGVAARAGRGAAHAHA